MSGRCRHPERDVFPLKWRPVSEEAYRAGYVISSMKLGTMHWTFAGNDQPQALWCRRCRSWLPLGHSDETPERVDLEIRAAELAAGWTPEYGVMDGTTLDEDIGWLDHCRPDPCRHYMSDEFHAGYLARVIATHEDETL